MLSQLMSVQGVICREVADVALAMPSIIRPDPRDPLVINADIAEMMRTGDSTFNVLVQERDIVIVPPTLLAQFGNFLSELISPLTAVFQSVAQSVLSVNRFNRFGNQRNRNNGFNIF